MSVLQKRYSEQVIPALQKKFVHTNPMTVPKLKKIVVSMGLSQAVSDKNAVQDAIREIAMITGQKAIQTKSKKSIANFKLREGMVVGLKVTLRKKRMYDFFYRFSNIVCPRIRDFRGFPKKGDGRGSYSLGLEDQQVFPEINLDEVKAERGMNITFVTSAVNDEESLELLTLLGMPFAKKN